MKLARLVGGGTLAWILAVAATFHYFLWLQTDQPYHAWDFIASADRGAFFDAARTTATLLGVAGLGAAALIAYRRQSTAEDTLRDERVKALHERYTTAAEQLGDQSSATRLAGVYALASLADDWGLGANHTREQQVCVDLLCAYLRAKTHRLDPQERDVRAAIVTSIQQRTQYGAAPRTERNGEWRGRYFNLKGVKLNLQQLDGIHLVNAELRNTRFRGTELNGAVLSMELSRPNKFNEDLEDSMRHKNAAAPSPRQLGKIASANMHATSFDAAHMRAADLVGCSPLYTSFAGADLTRACLRQTTLGTCNLTDAILVGADLTGARLYFPDESVPDAPTKGFETDGAAFIRADLTGAIFRYADATYADFAEATLTGADFTGASGLPLSNLADIKYDATTTWPDGFSPPPSR